MNLILIPLLMILDHMAADLAPPALEINLVHMGVRSQHIAHTISLHKTHP